MKKLFRIFFLLSIIVISLFLYFALKDFSFGDFSFENKSTNKGTINSNSGESFSFVVCGDPHANYNIYSKIIAKTNELKPDFFVNLGDITAVGADSEFKTFKNYMDKTLKVPYYILPGNHDVLKSKDYFKKYFDKNYYSWDLKGVHFSALDDVSSDLAFDDQELYWFENDLKNSNSKLKLVFVHIPPNFPFASLEDLRFKEGAKDQIEKFMVICKKYNVNKIYSGHIHNHYSFSSDGIPITITGGAGGPLKSIPIFAQDPKYHLLVVKVSGEEYTEEVIEVK